jgi:hypothetical protein
MIFKKIGNMENVEAICHYFHDVRIFAVYKIRIFVSSDL